MLENIFSLYFTIRMANFLMFSRIVIRVRELWFIPFKPVGDQWFKLAGDTVFSSVTEICNIACSETLAVNSIWDCLEYCRLSIWNFYVTTNKTIMAQQHILCNNIFCLKYPICQCDVACIFRVQTGPPF